MSSSSDRDRDMSSSSSPSSFSSSSSSSSHLNNTSSSQNDCSLSFSTKEGGDMPPPSKVKVECAYINNDTGEEEFEPSLQELVSTDSLKWIFVGGKGGVGKTTTSCAIAAELSKRRENVLILSTDPAHNLSDAFNQKFFENATLVNGFNNLYAMEIDSRYEESLDFRLSEGSSFSKMLPEMLQTFPGVDEALSFAELMQSVQTMHYDVIVFDTAPTGHTLRLLSFPDLLEKALNKLTQLKQQMATALNMINSFSGGNAREDDVIGKIDNLKAVTTSVRKTFQDPSKTTFVCVCIPEFLSVFETERLVQELARQSIDCSNIVVNQVLFPIQDEEDSNACNEGAGDVCEGANVNKQSDANRKHKNELGDLNDETNNSINNENEGGKEKRKRKETEEEKEKEERSEISLLEENRILKQQIEQLKKKLWAYESSHRSRRKMQTKYLSQIIDLYATDFHVVCMAQQSEEIRGVEKLKKFSQLLLQPKPAPLLFN